MNKNGSGGSQIAVAMAIIFFQLAHPRMAIVWNSP
jgi:hypothetical protein